MDRIQKTAIAVLFLIFAGVSAAYHTDTAGAAGLTGAVGAASPVNSSKVSYKIVVVQRGDSLWKIAKTHCPNRNTRQVVNEMLSINRIGRYIYAGNELKVPQDIPKKRSVKSVSRSDVGRVVMCEATAYTHTGNQTATQTWPEEKRTIAVDPEVIPLNSKVYVTCDSWSGIDGVYVAEDTGGFIKGNRIDLFMDSEDQAIQWGRRWVQVQILE